jgi:hypothetical protein
MCYTCKEQAAQARMSLSDYLLQEERERELEARTLRDLPPE